MTHQIILDLLIILFAGASAVLLTLCLLDLWDYLHFWDLKGSEPLVKGLLTQEHYIAVHESGHALCAWSCRLVKEIDKVHTVMESRGGLTHFTLYDFDTVPGQWCDLVITLAGMAAEIKVYGRTHSGRSHGDLTRCFEIADYLAQANELTPPWKKTPTRTTLPFHKMFRQLSPTQRSIIDQAYDMAHLILHRYDDKFHHLIRVLLDKKNLGIPEVEDALGSKSMMRWFPRSTLFVLPRSTS